MSTGVAVAHFVGAAAILGGLYYSFKGKAQTDSDQIECNYDEGKVIAGEEHMMIALIGDIGGTNIRLTLRKLNMKTRTSTEVKPLTTFSS